MRLLNYAKANMGLLHGLHGALSQENHLAGWNGETVMSINLDDYRDSINYPAIRLDEHDRSCFTCAKHWPCERRKLLLAALAEKPASSERILITHADAAFRDHWRHCHNCQRQGREHGEFVILCDEAKVLLGKATESYRQFKG